MSTFVDVVPLRILLLDRPTRSAERLAAALRERGYEVDATDEAERARARVREVDLALGDRELGGASLLEEALRLPDGPPVVLLDDFGSAADAAEAIRRGAFDVLRRPVEDDHALLVVARALERSALARENRRLRSDLERSFELGSLATRDERMRRAFRTLEAVAESDATVLVLGESGTGKTRLARALHGLSRRREGPFVEVSCGALPQGLLESELFGHRKGAFTGASADRAGKFEAADGGTLFLDEIATATPELQVRLLRAVEDRRFERVGDDATREVDVRLVFAANRELEEEVAAGRFREDLYWRIQVVTVRVPPLRERPADVPLLAERFLGRFAAEHGREVVGIGPEAMERLLAHPWPGNVRELENAIERAVLLAREPLLSPVDLWPDTPGPPARPAGGTAAADLPLGPLREVLQIPERALVVRALERTGGCRKEAARILGINRTTLFNKMRKYDLLEFPAGPRQDAD